MRRGIVLAMAVLGILELASAASAGTLKMKGAHYFDDDHTAASGPQVGVVLRARSP